MRFDFIDGQLGNEVVTQQASVAREPAAKKQKFYDTFPLPRALEEFVVAIEDEDPDDRNGVCDFRKKWALASIVANNDIKRSVEIGVYRGSSFLPTAAAMRFTGGVA